MAKKVFVSAAVLAVSCITAWGQTGYNVTYTNENDQYSHQNMATITKSENSNKTLVEAISEVNAKQINNAAIKKVKIVGDITSDATALSGITCTTIDLSEATFTSFTNNYVKYVVLPNGWTKEQVNNTAKAIGNSLESAASALGKYTYSDGFEYTDPYTKEKVQVEKGKIQTKDNDTYGLLTGIFFVAPTKEEPTYTYVDNGETKTYNGTLLFDKAGDAFGVKEGTTLVSLFPDTYLADNANNKYTGTITRKEEGAIYGNTGTAFDVDFSLDDYQYSSNGKNYVYFGDDTYTNGEKLYSPIPNDNIVKLNKIEEYHSYGPNGALVNINDYTIESEERLWDNNWKAYYVNGKDKWGSIVSLYIVDVYTYGEANTKYDTTNNPVYTKGEEYYGYTSAENPFKELTELTEKTYFNVETKEIYTGKVYDGEKGGTGEDVALTYVTDYYKDESKTQKYDGPATTDNKGVENAENYFALTSAYVYTYNDLAGNEHTKKSTVRMTEIQLTGDELYIAISPVKIQSELPTNVSLTAYVKKPGTLVYSILNMSQLESKYYDWYGNGIWYVDQTNNNYKYDYKAQNVKKITLSGNLNAIDLNGGQEIISDEGHFVTSGGKNYGALPFCSPDTLDLSDAIFGEGTEYHPEDMTISKLFPTLKSVLLPTHESQKVIPADCFNNMYLTELMIPSHYEVIGERAFSTSHTLSHIYVKNCETDSIYDHGDFTITLPESLKEIRSEGVESFDKATFSGNALEKVTDIYVMAEKAPKCGKYAFNAAITYGNNGFAGNWAHPIQRSNYINNEKVIAVLHYPATSRYNGQDKNFTDITRVYTLHDETGMVDGNGELKVWPRHAEFVRSFKQAKEGHIWTDWKQYANEGDTEVIIDNTDGQYTVANPTGYNQEYQGWHEFVLSETYIHKPYKPQEKYSQFDQYDWYTICIPYNITKSMLLQAFGVNTDSKYNNKVKLFDGNGEYIDAASVEGAGADGWIYPDVRSLIQVKRSYKNLMVTLCLSEELFTPEHCQEITIGKDGQGYEYTDLTDEDPIIIKAGMPYLIRPYVPVDTHIKNIGAYLCAYVSQLKEVEPVLFQVIEGSEKRYAVAQERGVETQALKLDESTESNRVYVMKDDGTACKYNFVGSYVDRFIPQYGYYLGKEKGTGKHKFFRTSKTTTKWNRYASIITGMSTPNYVNNGAENAKDIKNIELQFDGITDDLVIMKDEQPKNNHAAAKKLGIAFDDSGVNDLPTSIDEIDVEIALPEDNRIYTVNGTRVAADRLKKGIYIQNGKKIVVK